MGGIVKDAVVELVVLNLGDRRELNINTNTFAWSVPCFSSCFSSGRIGVY